MSGELLLQLEIPNPNSSVGAHKLFVLPGLSKAPAGFVILFTLYETSLVHPLLPTAEITML